MLKQYTKKRPPAKVRRHRSPRRNPRGGIDVLPLAILGGGIVAYSQGWLDPLLKPAKKGTLAAATTKEACEAAGGLWVEEYDRSGCVDPNDPRVTSPRAAEWRDPTVTTAADCAAKGGTWRLWLDGKTGCALPVGTQSV